MLSRAEEAWKSYTEYNFLLFNRNAEETYCLKEGAANAAYKAIVIVLCEKISYGVGVQHLHILFFFSYVMGGSSLLRYYRIITMDNNTLDNNNAKNTRLKKKSQFFIKCYTTLFSFFSSMLLGR